MRGFVLTSATRPDKEVGKEMMKRTIWGSMIAKTPYLYNICSFPRRQTAVMTIIASVKKVFVITYVQW